MQPADLESHLNGEDVAAYADRTLSESERIRIEVHLSQCGACRAEIVDVMRLLRRRPEARRWVGGFGIAAAAAAVVLLVLRPGGLNWLPSSTNREPPVTTAAAPTPVAPVGVVPAVPALTWTSVPRADRYRVQVFAEAGEVLWEAETPDTSAMVPDSVELTSGSAYFWKVEARTSFDRWAASELIGFTIGPPRE